MARRSPLHGLFISPGLALAPTLACLSAPVQAQEGSGMISAEKMRQPLRSITITFAPGEQDDLIELLRTRAAKAGFASRVSSDTLVPGSSFLQFYRPDSKLIGHISTVTYQLKIVL